MRDLKACEELASALKPHKYEVVVCSAFRDKSKGSLSRQQVAILSKFPAHAGWSEDWHTHGVVDPPRGYAFTAIAIDSKLIGFYSLHFKSNVINGSSESEQRLDMLKRELSAHQLVSHIEKVRQHLLPSIIGFVVGGDLNTNKQNPVIESEATLDILEESGLVNVSAGLSLKDQITHPRKKGGYKAAVCDYIFYTAGIRSNGRSRVLRSKVSDHWPLVVEVE